MSMDEAIENAVKEALDDRVCRYCKWFPANCANCDGSGKSPIWRILEAVEQKPKKRATITIITGHLKLCYGGVEYPVTASDQGGAIAYEAALPFGVVAFIVGNSETSVEQDRTLAEDLFTAILKSRR